MGLEQKLLDFYCQINSSENSEYLETIEKSIALNSANPSMSSNFGQGRILSMVSRVMQPKFILEIGTFMAYSTACLAHGLGNNGSLHTIEKNLDYKPLIDSHLSIANISGKVKVFFGSAISILDTLDLSVYDLVFIDAAKKEYPEYYEKIISGSRKGTLIIVDNVLWKGKVLEKNKTGISKAMDDFNKTIMNDQRVDNFILPFRDGLNFITVK